MINQIYLEGQSSVLPERIEEKHVFMYWPLWWRTQEPTRIQNHIGRSK